jgi:hypothetical protein
MTIGNLRNSARRVKLTLRRVPLITMQYANHKNGSINQLTVVVLVDGVVQVGEFNVDRHQRGEVAEGLLADDALGPGGAVHFALRVV